MERKIFCSKINKEIYLTFDTIPAFTMEEPNRYLIGLISKCSACQKNICEDCPLIKIL